MAASRLCERLNKALRSTRAACCRAGSLDHCERLRGVAREYYRRCDQRTRAALPDVPWLGARRSLLKGCR